MTSYTRVFVVQTDLTKLACDVVLVPTDIGFDVQESWRQLGRPPRTDGWGNSGVRVTDAVEKEYARESRIVRWVNTGSVPAVADVNWLIAGIEQALEAAGSSVAGRPCLNGRACPLVGLPLFGTGAGGYDAVRGEVLDRLLAACDAAAARHGYDVVIACWQRSDYAALQSRRLRRQETRSDGLSPELEGHAERLGNLARTRHLALFLGAGVSVPAGLPSWRELIERLSAGSSYSDQGSELAKIPFVDAFSLLERNLGEKFSDRLHDELSRPFHALGHALLASLRVPETITTNLDALYEQACAAPLGDEPRILPWQRTDPGSPWLLKMHGDLKRKLMVLSRDAYLGYDKQWRPLASMVQAAMMTRHMLFVGYSLTDENFVRLGREVSQLLEQMELDKVVGTVLTLRQEGMVEALWGQNLLPVAMASTQAPEPTAARVLEIFLDHMAMAAAADEHSYLLNPRYRALVENTGSAVLQRLTDLGDAVTAEPGDRWHEVRAMMRRYGYPMSEDSRQ